MLPIEEQEEIFSRALLLPETERAAFLEAECLDAASRAQIEGLLRAHVADDVVLDRPTSVLAEALSEVEGEASTPSQDGALRAGIRVGRYKLLERIGEGGMGVVYMALEEEPVRRKVAIKFVKPGIGTPQVVARFEAERQAMAMMEHPCITKVFGAGSTDEGLPYVVMELVRGTPITQFCADRKLDLEGRLRLFVQASRAVQHAHQKGVIHRDLKPSNILVTRCDGEYMPKIIDFGIAKALNHSLTDRTLFTRFGDVIGTLDYISPEQAEHSGNDPDTRSDVYSLGVVLYELVTGTTPFGSLKSLSIPQILDQIRSCEPERPSTRISTAARSAEVTDAPRLHDAASAKDFREDVDWIILKCLAKDRNDRYESAAALARDLNAYLDGFPTEAAAPTLAYQFRKLWRRRRFAALFAMTVAALLLAWAATSSWLLVKYRHESRRASEAVQLAQSRLAEADTERRRAEVSEAQLLDIERKQKYRIAMQNSQIRILMGEGADALAESFPGSDDPLLGSVLKEVQSALKLGMNGGLKEVNVEDSDAFLDDIERVLNEKASRIPSPFSELTLDGAVERVGSMTIVSKRMRPFQMEDAEQLEYLLDELRQVFPDRDLYILETLNRLATLSVEEKDWNQAELRVREVLALSGSREDGGGLEATRARLLLIFALAGTNREREARKLAAQVRTEVEQAGDAAPDDLMSLLVKVEQSL